MNWNWNWKKLLPCAAAALLFCTASAAETPRYKTPETSKLFRKVVSPDGVVSYLLEKRVADNQQSFYFTQKSMSEDGRFLLFYASPSRGKVRQVAMIDFKDESMKILGAEHNQANIPGFDTVNNKLYYINHDGIFMRDLNVDPMKEIKLCPIPAELKAMGTIRHYCTHVTLSKDRSKMFLDLKIDDRFVQGTVDLKTGRFRTWGITDFFINHGQINPEDDGIALAAWEVNWKDSKGVAHPIQKVNGIYPRLWLLYPDGTRKMIPSMTNYATHEYWTADGKGFYFCSGGKGVILHDLATGKQKQVVKHKASHAAMTADLSGVTFDFGVGPWWRGGAMGVAFCNTKTGKVVYLYRQYPAYNTEENPSKLHPDSHPHFACGDKYVITTVNAGQQRMELSVTPAGQLFDMTK